MGNWLGKKQAGLEESWRKQDGVRGRRFQQLESPAGSTMRIRVRMRKNELKELMEKVAESNGRIKLGNLILQESFKGRWQANVVVSSMEHMRNGSNSLPSIKQE